MADGGYSYGTMVGGRANPKDILQRYAEAKTVRSNYEPDWRMAAAYCLPRHYAAWNSEGPSGLMPNTQAAKRFAYDSTGARAVPKFGAILQRIATPDGHRWHKVRASDPNLMKSYNVRVYFDALNDLLFKMRYHPRANFVGCVGEIYIGLGVYGTAPYRLRWRPSAWNDRKGGFGYKALALKDVFIVVDVDGALQCVFVRMWMTARQFAIRFPTFPPPKSIAAELMKPNPSDTRYFEIVHYVEPRADWEENAITVKRHPILSAYIGVADGEYIGPEGGFRSFPYIIPRTATEPGDIYGFSPAMQAMPALGSVNAMKRTILRQGQKAVDPVILAHDDGVLSGRMGLTPGYVNYGAINAQGQKLVQALETGDFSVAEALLTDERNDVNDAFLVTLFQILTETPEMTATEVVERVSEKAALVAPTMGRVQNGMLGPQIEREIDLLAENAPYLMPEMPSELIEAQGEYEVIYTSPLAKGLTAEEDSGFMRMLETSTQLATATGDPAELDYYNRDVAIPELADHMAVPTRWMHSADEVAQIRQNRADQEQQQQVAAVAPPMITAAAAAQKAMVPAK